MRSQRTLAAPLPKTVKVANRVIQREFALCTGVSHSIRKGDVGKGDWPLRIFINHLTCQPPFGRRSQINAGCDEQQRQQQCRYDLRTFAPLPERSTARLECDFQTAEAGKLSWHRPRGLDA